MAKAYAIEFLLSEIPITSAVTKFGGQPCWLSSPQWPISKLTGQPMRFICQIALNEFVIFSSPEIKMAYVFITDDEKSGHAVTWEPDGNENAVIIQPGSTTTITQPLQTGPTLERWVEPKQLTFFQKLIYGFPKLKRVMRECEFSVRFNPQEDPEKPEGFAEETSENGFGNKIGGTPQFIQNPEYPSEKPWKLLLQLDSCKVPFEINFGDGGVGYVFISEDHSTGKLLWQCF